MTTSIKIRFRIVNGKCNQIIDKNILQNKLILQKQMKNITYENKQE